jgi:hypothetical protein
VPAATTTGQTTYGAIDLSKLFKAGNPQSVKKFVSEGLPVIRYGNGAGMLKNISVSSISDPALATINIIAADEASDEAASSTKKKGLPMIVTPTEVTVDMLGCPLINFGQSAYIDFGTGTTMDNVYACTSVNHSFSPGEFSTSAKFVINVGAYGIYNSTKRQLDLLAAQTQQANGAPAVSVTNFPPDSGPLTWSGISNPDVTLSVLKKENYSTDASAFRIWAAGNLDLTDYFERYVIEATNHEIVVNGSLTVPEILTRLNSNVTCYEIPYPQRNNVEVKGHIYSMINNVVSKQPVIVDLKTLQS